MDDYSNKKRVGGPAETLSSKPGAMRILLVSEDIPYPQMGGLAKHVLTLARALVNAGHEVDLMGGTAYPIDAAGREGEFGGRFFGELDGQHAGWKEEKLGVFMPPRRTWIARRFAAAILRRAKDYDVVHYHGHAPNVASFIPPHVNFVQTRHDQGSDCLTDTRFRNNAICEEKSATACAGCRTAHPNPLQTAVSTIAVDRYRNEVAQGFLRHKTVFVSDMLRRNFARTMGGQAQDWGSVVHNFIDCSRIEEARRRPAVDAGSGGTRIFVAGKLYAPKGVEPFLRELAGRLPPSMTVTIAGDGPDAEILRARFESETIRFLGWCSPEATLELCAQASAIVVPSICEESCSTTILEGLALGKPTFALAYGGTPELAIYAAFPEQLRLHADMRSLVSDLIRFDPANQSAKSPDILPGVEHALSRLLEIYARPPGFVHETDAAPSSCAINRPHGG